MPYLGEIRLWPASFAPVGWAFCHGQLLSISENDALFALIGTTYGGDGQETFALPNLQSRAPVHQQGSTWTLGEMAGVESVTLTTQQIPAHTHPLLGTSAPGALPDPGNNVFARSSTAGVFRYIADAPDVQLAQSAVLPVGGSQPHDNLQPYLVINFIISLFGPFPAAS